MALSDYERRVLDEIESELSGLGVGKLTRVRGLFGGTGITILCVAVAIAGIVMAAVFAPGWLAAPAAGLAGALAGFAISSTLLRRRGRSAGR
ncbi:MAG: hypothetical protein JWO57_3748 [Pseudonocardiales bacterium]|jgi:hypothetical protein|nr:hypothetical protein [Pseudonocardiales bacterium]